MCFSTNAIEQQAYETAEKIRNHSIYKFVRFECANGKAFDFDNPLHAEIPVITKVIFKDRNGNLYSIAPNHIGLKFAKGEMNYKEYKRIQKKDMAQGLGIVFITTGTFFSIGWAFVELMT